MKDVHAELLAGKTCAYMVWPSKKRGKITYWCLWNLATNETIGEFGQAETAQMALTQAGYVRRGSMWIHSQLIPTGEKKDAD